MLVILTLLSCQSIEGHFTQNTTSNNTQKISPELKERLYIRGDHYVNGKVPLNRHEKRAYQYQDNYIIEGKTKTKKVALTFDDGPSEYTPQIINKLNQHHIKATFFMVGTAIQSFPDLVKKIHSQGHLIANHSWDHTNATEYQVVDEYWQAQISSTNNVIKKLIGASPSFFRPPFGSTSDKIVKKLANQQMKTVIWSIDTQDWNNKTNSAKNIATRAIKHAHPESIILMHDGGGNRQSTVDALDEIIQYYQALNYEFVTVEELISSH